MLELLSLFDAFPAPWNLIIAAYSLIAGPATLVFIIARILRR